MDYNKKNHIGPLPPSNCNMHFGDENLPLLYFTEFTLIKRAMVKHIAHPYLVREGLKNRKPCVFSEKLTKPLLRPAWSQVLFSCTVHTAGYWIIEWCSAWPLLFLSYQKLSPIKWSEISYRSRKNSPCLSNIVSSLIIRWWNYRYRIVTDNQLMKLSIIVSSAKITLGLPEIYNKVDSSHWGI